MLATEEKTKTPAIDAIRSPKFLLPLAVICFSAPLWARYVTVINETNMMITVPVLLSLGFSFLFAFLSRWLIPNAMVSGAGNILTRLEQNLGLSIFLLAVLSVGGGLLVNQVILHDFMGSADEHSCYFLAESLKVGKWWVPPHPLSEFFEVVHVGNKEGKWFSVYPPGWPAILALGSLFNLQAMLNPIMTGFSCILLFFVAKRVYGGSVAVLGSLAAILTPFFLFTAGSYFSHSTSLLTVAAFLFCYFKWTDAPDEKQAMRWAFLTAVAIGYGLITRYLTMVAFAAPFLIYRFKTEIWDKKRIGKTEWVVIGTILFFMAIVFWQNLSVSGKLHKAPNTFDKSWERLGFRDFYTPLDAILFVVARYFYMMAWSPPALVLVGALLLFRRKSQSIDERLLRYAFFFPVIAYFFYFSWGGNQFGPRYYYEGFPFLIFAVADSLRDYWNRSESTGRKFILGLLVFGFGVSAYWFAVQGEFYSEASQQRKALYQKAEQEIEGEAIVFIRGFLGDRLVMSQDDAIRNDPLLRNRILYAHDRGGHNPKLMEVFPGRSYYHGSYDRSKKEAVLKPL